MTTAKYHFKRELSSPISFLGSQRASTDVLNALQQWSTMASGRSYDEVENEDDFIVARLTWASEETESAGRDLDALIDSAGIRRDLST